LTANPKFHNHGGSGWFNGDVLDSDPVGVNRDECHSVSKAFGLATNLHRCCHSRYRIDALFRTADRHGARLRTGRKNLKIGRESTRELNLHGNSGAFRPSINLDRDLWRDYFAKTEMAWDLDANTSAVNPWCINVVEVDGSLDDTALKSLDLTLGTLNTHGDC